jgi:hypothetical protein
MARQKQEYLFNSNDIAYKLYSCIYLGNEPEDQNQAGQMDYDYFINFSNLEFKEIYTSTLKDNLSDGINIELQVTKKAFDLIVDRMIPKDRDFTRTIKITRNETNLSDGYLKDAFLVGYEKSLTQEGLVYKLYFSSFEDFVLNKTMSAHTVAYNNFTTIDEQPYNYDKVFYNGNLQGFIADIYEKNLLNPYSLGYPWKSTVSLPRKARAISKTVIFDGIEDKEINVNWEKSTLKEILKKSFDYTNFTPKLKTKSLKNPSSNIHEEIQVNYIKEEEINLIPDQYYINNYKEELNFLESYSDVYQQTNFYDKGNEFYPNQCWQTVTYANTYYPPYGMTDWKFNHFRSPFLSDAELLLNQVDYYLPREQWEKDYAQECYRELNSSKALVKKTIELDFIDLLYFKDIRVGMILNLNDPIIGTASFRINQISEIFSNETNYLTFIIDDLEQLF